MFIEARFFGMQRRSWRLVSKAATRRRPATTPMCINELTAGQRERLLRLVREGNSFRRIERLTGHRRETISRYARRDGIEPQPSHLTKLRLHAEFAHYALRESGSEALQNLRIAAYERHGIVLRAARV